MRGQLRRKQKGAVARRCKRGDGVGFKGLQLPLLVVARPRGISNFGCKDALILSKKRDHHYTYIVVARPRVILFFRGRPALYILFYDSRNP